MWRTARAVTALVIGWTLLFAPGAVAAAQPAVGSSAVVAQAPAGERAQAPAEPSPGSDQSQRELTRDQQRGIGAAGVVLIALVLLSRRMRKKPVLMISWKRKG